MQNKKEKLQHLKDYLEDVKRQYKVVAPENGSSPKPQGKKSILFETVSILVKDTEKLLMSRKPWWYEVDLFEEKKIQVQILKYSLAISQCLNYDDASLHYDCYFMEKYSHTTPWSPYNEFKERFRNILDSVDHIQINRNFDKIKALRDELQKVNQDHYIQTAKLEFLKKLEDKEHPIHTLENYLNENNLEVVIRSITTEMMNEVNNVMNRFRKEVAEDRVKVREEIVAELKKVEQVQVREQEMDECVSNMVNEFSRLNTLLVILKEKYPNAFEECYKVAFANVKEKPLPQEGRNKGDKNQKVAPLLGKQGIHNTHSPKNSTDPNSLSPSSSQEFAEINL